MATSSLYFDKRSPRKDGTCPIKIRIAHHGKFYISTNIYILPEQWNEAKSTVIGHTAAAAFNRSLLTRKLQLDKLLAELSETPKIERMTILQVKDFITEKESTPVKEIINFKSFYLGIISNVANEKYKSSYETMFSKLSKYCDTDTLLLENITTSFLISFDVFMQTTGMSTNARAVYMRTLRTIINRALDEELITNYPFRRFKIKTEATVKRSLDVEELRELINYPVEEHQEKYRDMFLLIFFLIGINTVDLFSLDKITKGRVEYRRAKTKRLYSIKVEPEAMAILNRYKGTDLLLNVTDTYARYSDFSKKLNKNLQEIGEVKRVGLGGKKERKPLFSDLTTYWARHTWATIAASLEVPKETIATALGHGGNTVTDIYIDLDRKKADEANRKVIDFVVGCE